MKKSTMKNITHERSTDLMINTLKSVPELRIISRLDEALEARGLTQGKLATMCGLRPTTVSEMVNGSRMSVSKAHMASVMVALRITDIREIFDLEFSDETIEKFDREKKEWIENGVIPSDVIDIYKQNIDNMFNPDIKE